MGLSLREVENLAKDFNDMASQVGLKINQDKSKLWKYEIYHLHTSPSIHSDIITNNLKFL